MRGTIGDQGNVATLIEQGAVDSATGATQIAQRIGEVAKAAGEAVQISDEVQASADGLTKIAHGLKISDRRIPVAASRCLRPYSASVSGSASPAGSS